MGSRKKAKGKKKAPRKSGKNSAKNKEKLLRTQFMKDFERTFIYDKTQSKGPPDARHLWPPSGFANKDVAQDLTDVMQVLTARYAAQPVAVSGANPPPFRDRVIQFLTDRNWPTDSPVPYKYKQSGNEGTVHLVEIAVICDRMLEALNDGGIDGGGGSQWPPHTP